jgi:arginine decarboxylase
MEDETRQDVTEDEKATEATTKGELDAEATLITPYCQIGSRIPQDYVVAMGAGQSNKGPGIDPWETCAYDLALLKAGIENCNVVKYTSVLPPEARMITMEEAQKRGLFRHGMVLECIMAQVNGDEGQHICAGVGTMQVYWKENFEGEEVHIGGFAAEYEGYGSPQKAKRCLLESLNGIFERRYHGKEGHYRMDDFELHIKDLIVDDKFGTALVALCFLTFKIPTG